MVNRKSLFLITLVMISLGLASCASTTKAELSPRMYEEKPVSILVMPPINQSTNVDAKDYFYLTLAKPICNDGYYVFPTFLSLYTLQRESAYDSELFLNKSVKKFGENFGADVCLFTVIKYWNKSALKSDVEVEIDYIFKSTKTNQVLYVKNAEITVDTSVSTGLVGGLGLIADIIASTLNTAVTDYVKVARTCNFYALETENSIPFGPYHPNYLIDGEDAAQATKIRIKVDSLK